MGDEDGVGVAGKAGEDVCAKVLQRLLEGWSGG